MPCARRSTRGYLEVASLGADVGGGAHGCDARTAAADVEGEGKRTGLRDGRDVVGNDVLEVVVLGPCAAVVCIPQTRLSAQTTHERSRTGAPAHTAPSMSVGACMQHQCLLLHLA